jgi:hypothetical protein
MTPVNRPDLDRGAAVVDRLRDTTKALEARHEVDSRTLTKLFQKTLRR